MRIMTRSKLLELSIESKLLSEIEKIEHETLFYQHLVRAIRTIDTDIIYHCKINKKLSNLYNKLDNLLIKIRDKTYFDYRLIRVVSQDEVTDLIVYKLERDSKFEPF